ncbi:MAG TPA: nucleoside-diphosphate kinase [candidate division Zixibacteria bacterium]|nr:nucleoside-diphosphate kinase [candidate division Zixibacteria bacterium]MDD4918214.1 nucleoside-diphosphate kinase [candidate division Zixibacteria bacterium]MDM7973718.1 nucleoside-diphosphate kinase [candidate division Zixibacteria bacterium]HOD66437.1 nucleoside-diphosphate kinase [candidate division Zixibacteria bacterium]HOZ08315.1 nucleoside-diphosphate kinase [candidate division Zixibacteria bacterium]
MNRTLLIIKPDATERNLIGHVIGRLERAHFRIIAMRMERLTAAEAERFYEVHRERPFFRSLVAFMTSGPVVSMVLEKENAVADLRTLMGATNPAQAACGTIRQEIGVNVEKNSVHGSDSEENAQREIAFFFESPV